MSKTFLGLKNYFGPKKIILSKKIFGQKIFGQQFFWVKRFFGAKIFLRLKKICQKIFLGQIFFWVNFFLVKFSGVTGLPIEIPPWGGHIEFLG